MACLEVKQPFHLKHASKYIILPIYINGVVSELELHASCQKKKRKKRKEILQQSIS